MARVIHDDLVATLGAEAIAYSTLTKYLRAALTIACNATPLSDTDTDATNLSSGICGET
jgi:hypothetical protein